MKKTPDRPWTKPEKKFVEENYLLLPPFEIARRIKHIKGVPFPRTSSSVKEYMSRECMLNLDMNIRSFYRSKELCTALGIYRKRFVFWTQNGLETLQEIPGETAVYVTKAHFIEFAKSHPTHLFGISRAKLELFLPTDIADHVASLPRTKVGRKTSFPKRVRCFRGNSQAGLVYPSVSEAARIHNTSIGAIRSALKKGTDRNGINWEVVE